MPEQQNIEYKSAWHNDYLKWICGFANAQDRRIYIGKDDADKTVGVENYRKPMDEIDTVLAERYGFTEEELDFIINYDIKYRMGKELEDN
jgi:ATP-dependent DNA helicase RecG